MELRRAPYIAFFCSKWKVNRVFIYLYIENSCLFCVWSALVISNIVVLGQKWIVWFVGELFDVRVSGLVLGWLVRFRSVWFGSEVVGLEKEWMIWFLGELVWSLDDWFWVYVIGLVQEWIVWSRSEWFGLGVSGWS